MTKKQKKGLLRIGITAGLYAAGIATEHAGWNGYVWLMGAGYVLISYDVLRKSAINIVHWEVFDENFLMSVASLGAVALGQLDEAVAVMLFYQIGEWFQSYAVSKSRKSIAALMDIRPDYANIEENGTIRQVDPEEVQPGTVIVVEPGERVPLDGVVENGDSSLDTSALTGESVPRHVHPGSEVISGCINQTGVLYVRTTRPYGQSTVAKVLELVENATDRKAPAEQFITRFARVYTPVVCGLALGLAVLPPLLFAQPWHVWIYRALTFLVISCPCALVISVPLSFFGGIGGASKAGILVKGSTYLEALADVKTMVFDKTGTITKGTFQVTDIQPADLSADRLLVLAAAAESHSSHPIAQSILEKAHKLPNQPLPAAGKVQEVAGQGVSALVDGSRVLAGNEKLMIESGIPADVLPEGSGMGTVVYVAVDGVYAGMIEISDQIKEDSRVALTLLRQYGLKKFVMLTGDNEQVARRVAGEVGIDEYHARLLPQDKVEILTHLLEQNKTAFVGDGINDAPVLAAADVGIAMGALGSDAAIEAADVVLMKDRLSQIVTAIAIAHKTLRIVRQNIFFAIAVKVLILILGALGLANMWAAVFADVGVAFLCILNAMRCLRVPVISLDRK
ncbi:heavy metal translocating P-type ATPase [uncultured Faecalibaculum sp.]|uniref:heavy metal translocating P-type ATPase n=1 Tax=uncultured Faecalibaculum sp. TaxID=1729681 RepID=UPI0026293132|nr:heavy metal translocating P-type ATPase [uncultured Faecalibaculum sp.]